MGNFPRNSFSIMKDGKKNTFAYSGIFQIIIDIVFLVVAIFFTDANLRFAIFPLIPIFSIITINFLVATFAILESYKTTDALVASILFSTNRIWIVLSLYTMKFYESYDF